MERIARWWTTTGANATSIAITALAFIGLLMVSVIANDYVQPDVAMYLHCGQLILDGQLPYVDFVEVNPPMTMYLSVIPAFVARHLGTPVVETLYVLVTALAAVGAWSLWRFTARFVPDMRNGYRHLLVVAWLGFSWMLFYGGHIQLVGRFIGSDYGQREHFFTLGYIPLMLLRWARWEQPAAPVSRVESVVVGLLGGATMWIKPHFALMALLVELSLWLVRGRYKTLFQLENLIAAAVGVTYLAHFALPFIYDAFVGRWLPLAASRYRVYHFSWEHVFNLDTLDAVAVMLVAYMLPWRQPYLRYVRMSYPLAVFCVAGTAAMIAQHKGWPYHLIPILAGVWLFGWLLAVRVMQHQEEHTGDAAEGLGRAQRFLVAVRPQLLSSLFLAWGVTVVAHTDAKLFAPHRSDTLDFIEQHTTRDDAILWVSTSVPLIYPEMLHSGRKPGSRYLWTFPIAYLFEGHDKKLKPSEPAFYAPPRGREQEEARLVAELLEDVDQRRPKIAFVHRKSTCQACPVGFSIDWYARVNGLLFGLQQRGYREGSSIGEWAVWLRDDVVSGSGRRP